MQSENGAPKPVALKDDEGEALWFLDSLVTIKADTAATGGRFAISEHLAPRGSGPPLHVHTREDEWFYILKGELAFWVGGQRIDAPAGSFVLGPRGIPHTFVVASAEARYLLGTEPGGFDNFMRAFAVPAAKRTLPPATGTPPDVGRLTALAAEYGIEILGPPGLPE